jgi:hypothetical protein
MGVSEVKWLQVYNGYVQRPFPNGHKRPFGCKSETVAIHNGFMQRPFPNGHKRPFACKGHVTDISTNMRRPWPLVKGKGFVLAGMAQYHPKWITCIFLSSEICTFFSEVNKHTTTHNNTQHTPVAKSAF